MSQAILVRSSTMALVGRFVRAHTKTTLPKVSCFRPCLGVVNVKKYSSRQGDNGNNTEDPTKDLDRPRAVGEYKDPIHMLKQGFRSFLDPDAKPKSLPIPRETDICIIGGGAVGSAAAYWLKQRNPEGFQCAVIEKDPTYTKAATCLSVGGLRQQFSLKENIEMSLFTAEFLRKIKEHLGIMGKEPPDVQFNPQGYLFMATEKGADDLELNFRKQIEVGARIEKLTPSQLKAKFPWINTEDIVLATYGTENEGWFDPWLLLQAFRNKATSLGANYYKGEVVGFRYEDIRGIGYDGLVKSRKKLDQVEIKYEDGQIYPMKFAMCLNCAGPWSGEIARMAGIGAGEGVLRIPLPVEPRKRYVYVIHCPNGPGLDTPMMIDPSGVYLRREGFGGHYICGASPSEGEEPSTDNLDVDYDFFSEKVWPHIAHRVPAFESLKEDSGDDAELTVDPQFFQTNVYPKLVHRIPGLQDLQLKSAWAGYYDYNYFDQNLILGNHPYHKNFIMATGCSGHGIQQSPAIGRAVMELLLDNDFQTIDLSRFNYDRVLDDDPIFERCII